MEANNKQDGATSSLKMTDGTIIDETFPEFERQGRNRQIGRWIDRYINGLI
jgi:hypothetical protein